MISRKNNMRAAVLCGLLQAALVRAGVDDYAWTRVVRDGPAEVHSLDAVFAVSERYTSREELLRICRDMGAGEDMEDALTVLVSVFREIGKLEASKTNRFVIAATHSGDRFKWSKTENLNETTFSSMASDCDAATTNHIRQELAYDGKEATHADYAVSVRRPQVVTFNKAQHIPEYRFERHGRFDYGTGIDPSFLKRYYAGHTTTGELVRLMFTNIPPFHADVVVFSDTGKDMSVVRVEYLLIGQIVRVLEGKDFVLTASGLWYPAEWKDTYYAPGFAPHVVACEKQFSVVCNKVSLNEYPGEGAFTLQYPDGVSTMDLRVSPSKYTPGK